MGNKSYRGAQEGKLCAALGESQPQTSQIAVGQLSSTCQLQHLELMDTYYFCLGRGKKKSILSLTTPSVEVQPFSLLLTIKEDSERFSTASQ